MLNDTYEVPIYYPNLAVRSMRNFPRFGYSDQVADLFSRTDDDKNDYSFGMAIIGGIFASFFLSWFVTLMVLLCLGSKRVGFLSGNHMKEPKPTKFPKREFQRPIWVRTIFMVSSIIVLASLIILAIEGFKGSEDLVENSRIQIQDVSNVIDQGKDIVNHVQDIGSYIHPIRDDLVNLLRDDTFCLGGNLVIFPNNVRAQINITSENLVNLENFILNNLRNLEFQLNRARNVVNDVDDNIEKYRPDSWMFLAYTIPMVLVCTLMTLGVIFAWTNATHKKTECVLSWFILPIFMLGIFLGCLLCAFVAAGSVAIADTCYGNSTPATPDNTMLQIIDHQDWGNDSLLYKGATYYVDRCERDFPFEFLVGYKDKLDVVNRNLDNLDKIFETAADNNATERTCSGNDYPEILEVMSTVYNSTTNLSKATSEAINLLQCRNLNFVYTQISQKTICEKGSSISFFSFIYSLFISFFGLLMITMRSAYLEVEYYEGKIPMDQEILEIEIPNDPEKSGLETMESGSSSENTVRQVTGDSLQNEEKSDEKIKEDGPDSTRSWEAHPVAITPSENEENKKGNETGVTPDSTRSWEKLPVALQSQEATATDNPSASEKDDVKDSDDSTSKHFNFKQY